MSAPWESTPEDIHNKRWTLKNNTPIHEATLNHSIQDTNNRSKKRTKKQEITK